MGWAGPVYELMGPDRRRPGSQRVWSPQRPASGRPVQRRPPGRRRDLRAWPRSASITGRHACAQVSLALEARTTDWALPSDVGERVHLNPTRGFWCLNREQPRGRSCSNYHVRSAARSVRAGLRGPQGPAGGAGGPKVRIWGGGRTERMWAWLGRRGSLGHRRGLERGAEAALEGMGWNGGGPR